MNFGPLGILRGLNSSKEDRGVKRSSRQNTNKKPLAFGNPVKHSVKEISADEDSGGVWLRRQLQPREKNLKKDREDCRDTPLTAEKTPF